MRKMKTGVTLSALLSLAVLSSSALWVSSASAQGEAEAGADSRSRIRLAEEPAAPTAEAETSAEERAPVKPPATTADTPESDAAAASEGEQVPTERTGSEVATEPTQEPVPNDAVPKDAVPNDGTAEDKSQPRIIDISADDDVAKEDLPPTEEPKISGSQLPFTYHMNHVDVSGGFRVVGTGSEGLEPFLVDPVLADVYVRAGMAFAVADRIALAPHLELGGASTSATVRGMSSELDKTHLSLGLEGRYHFIHRMFGYVRVAPGLEFVTASIGDDGDSGVLVNDNKRPGSVAFQLDAAVGASIRLFGSDDGRKRNPRLWAFAEGGYRASTDHKLNMVIDSDGPRRAVPIELSPLDFSGGFFSAGLMASF